MIEPLSPRDEERLLRALSKAAEDPDVYEAPDEALAKVAAALGLPAGHIPILVRGYNTARATQQFAEGKDAIEKAASFPIASAAGIMRRLYPDEPETPALLERTAGISSEYAFGPSWYQPPGVEERRARTMELLTRPVGEKTAGAGLDQSSKKERFQAAYRRSMAAQQMLEHGRLKLAEVQQRAHRELDGIIGMLTAIGSPTWADVRATAAVKYGADGAAVLDQVARMVPSLDREASRERYHSISRYRVLYDRIGEAVKLGRELMAAAQAHDDATRRTHEKIAEELNEFLDEHADENAEDDQDELLGNLKAAGPGNFGKAVGTGLVISSARDAIDSLLHAYPKPDAESRINGAVNKLNDPIHESSLRDLEAQYMLQDMLLNDPVLSSHDPNDVAAAFNEISRTAPHYATQPLLIRPLLRKSLEMGPLDSFEGHEAVNTEHKLRQINSPEKQDNGARPNAAAGRNPLG